MVDKKALERQKTYYRKNKEKILLKQKEKVKNNPEYFKEQKLKQRYNITLEDYKNILMFQEGLCAICKIKHKLFVDHNHNSGLVRALLCKNCNFGLGFFKDNIFFLERAIYYLKTKVINN